MLEALGSILRGKKSSLDMEAHAFKLGVAAHSFNPNTQNTVVETSEFEASLVYRTSSRTVIAIQRNPA